MRIAQRLLNLVLARRYQITDHALESLDEDGLALNDVISCLGTGRLRRSWPRQHKYEIDGRAVDGRRVRVVARLLEIGRLRIITVYEVR
jgi:hypothetical protein